MKAINILFNTDSIQNGLIVHMLQMISQQISDWLVDETIHYFILTAFNIFISIRMLQLTI
jgi:hypothetical protein